MMRRAFTLVELLTVIAIIAILAAILYPVAVRAQGAITSMTVLKSLQQLGPAHQMYMTDHDERMMPCYYAGTEATVAWYGTEIGPNQVDEGAGFLFPYLKGTIKKDPTHFGLPYKGNGRGYGYNWGYLGSSAYLTEEPHRRVEPAAASQISEPAETAVFATCALYQAPWLGGDGATYDYGFIDPPATWEGAPTVDFRHGGTKRIEGQQLLSDGTAPFVFADGHARMLKQLQVTDRMFARE